MDAAEPLEGKYGLYSLQGDQGEVVATSGGELAIVLPRFNVVDILKVDFQILPLVPDEDKRLLVGRYFTHSIGWLNRFSNRFFKVHAAAFGGMDRADRLDE